MWASLPFASSPEHCMPHIQFLLIGSRLCSTLLSDLTSRFGPCASLSLHLHLVVKRTCTSQLSDMLGTQKKKTAETLTPLPFFGCEPQEERIARRYSSSPSRPLKGAMVPKRPSVSLLMPAVGNKKLTGPE